MSLLKNIANKPMLHLLYYVGICYIYGPTIFFKIFPSLLIKMCWEIKNSASNELNYQLKLIKMKIANIV